MPGLGDLLVKANPSERERELIAREIDRIDNAVQEFTRLIGGRGSIQLLQNDVLELNSSGGYICHWSLEPNELRSQDKTLVLNSVVPFISLDMENGIQPGESGIYFGRDPADGLAYLRGYGAGVVHTELRAADGKLYIDGSALDALLAATVLALSSQFVVLTATANLLNERVLTAGTGISITDGGAGGPVTIAATGGGGGYQTLTDGATINWNLASGSAQVTIAGNRTLANPTNMVAGTQYFLLVIQDGTGSRLLTWGSNYRFEGGVKPILSAMPNARDLFEFMSDGTYMYCQRMTRNVGAVWSPLNIATLRVWLDASQLTGLVDGDAIASWTDMSGYSNHAVQATAAYRPLYKTNIKNGLPVARWDGTNDVMTDAYSLVAPFSIFIVAYLASTSGWRTLLSSTVTGDRKIQSKDGYWVAQNASGIITGQASGINWRLHSYIHAAAAATYYINGVSRGSNGGSGDWSAWRIGSESGNNWQNGDTAEVLIFAGELSSADRQAVEEYLRAKYDLY